MKASAALWINWRADEPFVVSLEDAARTSLAILAIMESAKTRMPVEVDYSRAGLTPLISLVTSKAVCSAVTSIVKDGAWKQAPSFACRSPDFGESCLSLL